MITLVERKHNYWMLPLVEINVHQVGVLPLVEREYHHWMLHIVKINVHQGLPLVESGDHSLPPIESVNQGTMDPSKHV